LCTAAGDKVSLAIAMAGLLMDHVYQGRLCEASRLASEAMALIESVGDPTLTVGLSPAPIRAKATNAEYSDVLRWSQRAIDLAEGDPYKGNLIIGSPLAIAFATRAIARWCLGRPDGAMTCGRAWPWPAAPTPCLTPQLSLTSTSREYRLAC
jgi:hypothetical protein